VTGAVFGAAAFGAFALWLLLGPSPAVCRLGALRRSAVSETAAVRRGGVGGVTMLPGSDAARWAVAALAGVAVALLVTGWIGIVGGVAATVGAHRWLSRQESAAARSARLSIARDLPLVAELLAAAVQAGGPLGRGIDAVAASIDGPLADRLRTCRVAEACGAAPEEAWAPLKADPVTGELGRLIVESAVRGTAPAAALSALAADLRSQARLAADGVARSLGARAAAPLGLCFLPAFLLLGVVPLVAAAAAALVP
jgi:Flp pilus assembly protein TadB